MACILFWFRFSCELSLCFSHQSRFSLCLQIRRSANLESQILHFVESLCRYWFRHSNQTCGLTVAVTSSSSHNSIVIGCWCKRFISFSMACNSRLQSASYVLRYKWLMSSAAVQGFWLLKHRSFMALTNQSSGTSVKILVSNLSSGASAPYFRR